MTPAAAGRAPGRRRPAGRRIFLAACLLAACGLLRAAEGTALDEEIDFLIAAVADSTCTFIRNGREHDAAAASEHLQMKRERGRRYYDSTEQFIERIASKSSWSGKDYLIRCDDLTVTANEWFSDRLAEYRGGD